MGIPQVDDLRRKVMHAEHGVTLSREQFGRDSEQYRSALKEFAVSWFVLKKTRDPQEFVKEISR